LWECPFPVERIDVVLLFLSQRQKFSLAVEVRFDKRVAAFDVAFQVRQYQLVQMQLLLYVGAILEHLQIQTHLGDLASLWIDVDAVDVSEQYVLPDLPCQLAIAEGTTHLGGILRVVVQVPFEQERVRAHQEAAAAAAISAILMVDTRSTDLFLTSSPTVFLTIYSTM